MNDEQRRDSRYINNMLSAATHCPICMKYTMSDTVCSDCQKAIDEDIKCHDCGGRGVLRVQQPRSFVWNDQACKTCKGTGLIEGGQQ